MDSAKEIAQGMLERITVDGAGFFVGFQRVLFHCKNK